MNILLFQTYCLERNISLSDSVGLRSDCTLCAVWSWPIRNRPLYRSYQARRWHILFTSNINSYRVKKLLFPDNAGTSRYEPHIADLALIQIVVCDSIHNKPRDFAHFLCKHNNRFIPLVVWCLLSFFNYPDRTYIAVSSAPIHAFLVLCIIVFPS